MRIYVTLSHRKLFELDPGPLPKVGDWVKSHEGPRPVLLVERVVVGTPGIEPFDRITLGNPSRTDLH
jgi:hypothetical protein